MSLAPTLEHTIVTGLSKEQVLKRVDQKTQEVDSEYLTPEPLFNGKVTENGFRISRIISTPQNALPLLVGKVENTSRGAIIFLQLRLFPAAVLYLRIFSTLSVLIGMVFLLIPKLISVALLSFSIAIANYVILTLNFHRKGKESLKEISQLLEVTE